MALDNNDEHPATLKKTSGVTKVMNEPTATSTPAMRMRSRKNAGESADPGEQPGGSPQKDSNQRKFVMYFEVFQYFNEPTYKSS